MIKDAFDLIDHHKKPPKIAKFEFSRLFVIAENQFNLSENDFL